jgi:hypothetical protein
VRRIPKMLAVLLVLAGAAVATDRIALLVWRARVISYSHALETAAVESIKGGPNSSRPPLMIHSGGRGKWQVPLLEVAIRGPAPEAVTVDGNGGINLLYVPPLLAWSRHVPWAYRRPVVQAGDLYPYNDVYLIKLSTLEDKPGGQDLQVPKVQLEHGFPY